LCSEYLGSAFVAAAEHCNNGTDEFEQESDYFFVAVLLPLSNEKPSDVDVVAGIL
jgi:hypothetical protein